MSMILIKLDNNLEHKTVPLMSRPHVSSAQPPFVLVRFDLAAMFSCLGQRRCYETHKHHANRHPLPRKEGIRIPDHRDEDVEELAGGAHKRVDEGPELLDGEEDEELRQE